VGVERRDEARPPTCELSAVIEPVGCHTPTIVVGLRMVLSHLLSRVRRCIIDRVCHFGLFTSTGCAQRTGYVPRVCHYGLFTSTGCAQRTGFVLRDSFDVHRVCHYGLFTSTGCAQRTGYVVRDNFDVHRVCHYGLFASTGFSWMSSGTTLTSTGYVTMG